jgi:ABC-type uncharacterized transport system permease subunit
MLLFVSGVGLGMFGARHALLLGIGAISPLVAGAIAEMVAAPTSHNLWPLEFLVYLLLSLVVAAGVPFGRYLGRCFRHQSDDEEP